MIGYLEGKLRHKSPDQLIIDVHGVGYCVQVPLSTFYELPALGQTVTLHIHTHVREDALLLLGFRSLEEREMFLHLVIVNGVGPRLAMNILSGISANDLRQVILEQNPQRLKNIPGVGKKIAERILLELRDKLKLKRDKPEEAVPAVLDSSQSYADAFSALLNLGYRGPEAEKALHQAKQAMNGDAPLEKLLREALRLLA